MIEATPTFVVFGLDPDGNSRAGKFPQGDAELATKIASLLGYRVTRIDDPAILGRLREGNVFARGNGIIGRVTRAVFDKLLASAIKGGDADLGATLREAGL